MNDPIPAADIDTSEWLTWNDYLTAPSGSPSTSFPPIRAPEILRHCEQIGADPTTYGQLDPADQQALRVEALNRIADRLADIGKEISRLSDEVRANA